MAEAVVVTVLVTIAAEGILKKVLSLAESEVVLAWGYKEMLTRLHDTLDRIHAKLGDADRQNGTEAVMVWLKQLKQAVTAADDVLDEIHYEMLKREVKKRDRMTKSLKKFLFRREMGPKIENINRKLVEIYTQANNLGLQNEQRASIDPDLNRETDPYLEEEFKIYGRENNELEIIQLITQTRKEEKLTVVPIVGMAGIGKTTLAKSIYNNPKINQHFEVKTWLCVSVKVCVNTLLAKIYESLAREEPKSQMRVNLITDLRNQLGSKRYLLVLDDVWDEDKAHWDDFRSCMLKVHAKGGSGILVTTRNHEIGTKVMSEGFHALEGLSDDSCWSIFKEKAFLASPLPELVEIGRHIVKKCHGSPLLANVMGGMLRYRNKEKWLSIKDSKVWDLKEEGGRVQNRLKLSFDNLPNSSVKQCFTYCSMFKKDEVLEREELVRLWMALGLVHTDDVGNDIFQILVNNSLFQDVRTDEYGYVTCGMHDLVHDLSISLSKHESLRLVGPTRDDIAHITQVKHIAILHPDWEDENNITFKEMILLVFNEDMITPTLQTLIFKGKVEKNISFQCFKRIRILKFEGCELEKLDDSIGKLEHLRYLDLSNTYIEVLPESIGKLYHLQTLKLPGWPKKWPKKMHNLISLRHLMIGGDVLSEDVISIPNVGQLTSLRSLPFFKVGSGKGCEIEELGCLKHLSGHLHITNLEKVSSRKDAAKADLFGKNLHQISFCWSPNSCGANRNDKDVLEGLQPPHNVKSLMIVNFSGDNFPAWVMKMAIDIEGKWMPLHKLVHIKLKECSCLCLPVLTNLPLLKSLFLEALDNLACLINPLGESDNVNTRSISPLFPSLRTLQLTNMRRLEKWVDAATTNNSTMLSLVLESLSIHNCPKITHLDECYRHPLLSLKISNCNHLVSIKSIQGLTSLESLNINDCPSLLEIDFLKNYKCHPLKSLSIRVCEKLTCMPSFVSFSLLNTLELGRFSQKLHSFPSLQGIEKARNHLRLLRLYGWDHWESIPQEIKSLTSLTQLAIDGFGIQELPMWLTDMSSIREMRFYNCKGLDKEKVKWGVPREADVFLDCESCQLSGYI